MRNVILLAVLGLIGYAIAVNQPDHYAEREARIKAIEAETQRLIDANTPDLHPPAAIRTIAKDAIATADRIDRSRVCTEIGREIKAAAPMQQSDYLRALITRVHEEDGVVLKNQDYSLIKSGRIKLGISSCAALAAMGSEPKHINRSVGSYGIHEQWVYSSMYLYFEDGILTSWQD